MVKEESCFLLTAQEIYLIIKTYTNVKNVKSVFIFTHFTHLFV